MNPRPKVKSQGPPKTQVCITIKFIGYVHEKSIVQALTKK